MMASARLGMGPLTLRRPLQPQLGQMENNPLLMQLPRKGEKCVECKW